jgi:hypothetical protein
MATLDTELLISHFCGSLDPADRDAFRHVAEAAVAESDCWGEGQIYRTITELWRGYFRPPPDMRHVTNHSPIRRTKLIQAPPIGRSDRCDEL